MTTIDATRARAMLLSMLRIRRVEEAIAARYPEREMRCPVHLSIGQEAAAVGVIAALAPADLVMSAHRAHAHYLAKGGDLDALVAELYGKATGCTSGKGGSMHLLDVGAGMIGATPIVAGSLPVAVGTAFGAWMQGHTTVTAVFLGEGATEQGVFAECLNFAALKALPVLFVCENNGYSVYSPLDVRQAPGRDRCALAAAHGLVAVRADGNDVERTYLLAAAAVERARAGRGPSYLELDTYRWLEHCGPNVDDDLGYRTPEEAAAWHARCPLATYRDTCLARGVVTEADLIAAEAAIRVEIEAAFARAKAAPFPPESALLDGVYAEALHS